MALKQFHWARGQGIRSNHEIERLRQHERYGKLTYLLGTMANIGQPGTSANP